VHAVRVEDLDVGVVVVVPDVLDLLVPVPERHALPVAIELPLLHVLAHVHLIRSQDVDDVHRRVLAPEVVHRHVEVDPEQRLRVRVDHDRRLDRRREERPQLHGE